MHYHSLFAKCYGIRGMLAYSITILKLQLIKCNFLGIVNALHNIVKEELPHTVL